MAIRWTIASWLTLLPAIAAAQIAPTDLAYLRNKAVAEGAVDVKVITHVVANRARASRSTGDQRIEEQRAQHNLVIALVRQGLLVGNEINVQPDGSLTMRVLPKGLEHLALHAEVARLDAAASTMTGERDAGGFR